MTASASANNVASLSGACKEFLGKGLSKTQQLSDWDARPLSDEQLHYASLDAYATLSLLDAMLLRSGVKTNLNLASKFGCEEHCSGFTDAKK